MACSHKVSVTFPERACHLRGCDALIAECFCGASGRSRWQAMNLAAPRLRRGTQHGILPTRNLREQELVTVSDSRLRETYSLKSVSAVFRSSSLIHALR